jgi:hypothetical protein
MIVVCKLETNSTLSTFPLNTTDSILVAEEFGKLKKTYNIK